MWQWLHVGWFNQVIDVFRSPACITVQLLVYSCPLSNLVPIGTENIWLYSAGISRFRPCFFFVWHVDSVLVLILKNSERNQAWYNALCLSKCGIHDQSGFEIRNEALASEQGIAMLASSTWWARVHQSTIKDQRGRSQKGQKKRDQIGPLLLAFFVRTSKELVRLLSSSPRSFSALGVRVSLSLCTASVVWSCDL